MKYSEFKDGEYVIPDLPVGGEYNVKELNAETLVAGYKLLATSTTSGEGTIAKDPEVVVKLTNNYAQEVGKISVKKTVEGVDSGDKSKVKDKEFIFTITNKDDKSIKVTLKVKDGETKTTGDLPLGKYTVSETTVASIDGYELVSKAADQTVEIKEDGRTVSVTEVNKYKKEDKYGSVILYKEDSSDNHRLEGAQFGLYKSDGSEVGKYWTNYEGSIFVGGLPYGDYYFREISAPAGYDRTEDLFRFTISSSNTQAVTIVAKNSKHHEEHQEEKRDVLGAVRDVGQAVLGASRGVLGATRTGDDSHALLAGFISLGSLAGIFTWLIVWFIKRRKRNAAA